MHLIIFVNHFFELHAADDLELDKRSGLDLNKSSVEEILSKWMEILDNKNEIIMEYEASQRLCNGYKSCPCLNRLLNALRIYNVWNKKHPSNWVCTMWYNILYSNVLYAIFPCTVLYERACRQILCVVEYD